MQNFAPNTEQQKKTIELLEKLAEKYRDKGERSKARNILKAIKGLENKPDNVSPEGSSLLPVKTINLFAINT